MEVTAFPKYDEYKDTNISWIGEIPKDWEIIKAKWLFKKMERPIRAEDGVVTAFRDGEVTLRTNRRTDGFTNALKEHGYQGIRKNDLVIHAMDAFAGAIGVSDSDGKSTPVYSVCTPKNHFPVNTKYYAYLLRYMAISGYIEALAKGIRERSTDFRFNDFATLLLPNPKEEEQNRIVAFLDEKTAEIDTAIVKKQQLIQLLNEQKAILINRAVTKGLNPSVKMKDSGVPWIGEIPENWKVNKLKYVVQKIYDCKNRTPDYFADGKYFVIRTSNVRNGSISFEKGLYTNEQNFLEWTRKGEPLVGDLVFTREAPAGEVAQVPSGMSMCLGQRMMGIKANDSLVLGDYILYALQSSSLKSYVAYSSSGSTVSHLRVGQVFDIQIAFPTKLEEQKSISQHSELVNKEVKKAISIIEQDIEKLQELRQVLITSATTGKIKV